MKLGRSIIVDGKRLWDSRHLIYGILALGFYMMISRLEDMVGHGTVYIVTEVMHNMSFLLTTMITYAVFGNSLLEDFQHKYIHQVLLRHKSLLAYTVSKTFWVFLTCMCTMACGMVLFTVVTKANHVWTDEFTQYLVSTMLGSLYVKKHYVLYLFVAGLQYGILAGMMAMIGCMVSLIIRNRLLAGASCVVGMFICNFLKGIFWHEGTNLFGLFDATYNLRHFSDTWISHCLWLGLSFYVVGTVCIYAEIKWRLRNE